MYFLHLIQTMMRVGSMEVFPSIEEVRAICLEGGERQAALHTQFMSTTERSLDFYDDVLINAMDKTLRDLFVNDMPELLQTGSRTHNEFAFTANVLFRQHIHKRVTREVQRNPSSTRYQYVLGRNEFAFMNFSIPYLTPVVFNHVIDSLEEIKLAIEEVSWYYK